MSASLPFPQIVSLAQKGLFREAIAPMSELVNQHPDNAEYWHFYSVIALKVRDIINAVEHARNAIRLQSSNPDYRAQLAMCLLRSLQISEALNEAQAAQSMSIKNPATWDSLGTVYTGCNDLNRAQEAYQHAVNLAPDVMHFQFNLATACRSNGQLEQAEAIYDKVIADNPHDYEAYANRSQLRRQTPDNNHISELQTRLAQGVKHWREESQLYYALAKECEDTEHYVQSFDYLRRGADIRRRHMTYNVDGDLAAIEKIIDTFSQKNLSQCQPGFDSQEPIFILGLPRTGTTLVEQILSSHSDVYSAGELQQFASQMIKHVVEKYPNEKLNKLTLIEKSTTINFDQLGRNYIESTRPATGNTPHFIDKLPLNYLYIGLIKMALPNAKIIHLTRHPMDTCYAIYKTLFRDAYPFSYDLIELGRYYLAYQQLMAHWRQVLPAGSILDLNYENLVQNQEQESRRLIDYCGLTWQENCLHFYKNQQASTTASAAQVRQPIYTDSVQKWRHYDSQLEPLADLLKLKH
jgi:Flp pilus assembly protein TadD